MTRRAVIGASRRFERDLKRDAFDHLVALPVPFFDRVRTGDLLSRLTSDVEAVRFSVGPGIMYLAQTAVKLPAALIAMLSMEWRLACLVLVPLSGIAVVVRKLSPAVLKGSRAVQDRLADLSSKAQENFAGARVVRAYALEDREKADFLRLNERLVSDTLGLARSRAFLSGGLRLSGDLGLLAVVAYGGHLVTGRVTDVPTLVAFLFYLDMLVWPMISFGYVLASFQRASAAMGRLDELFATAPEPATTLPAVTPPARFRGDLELRHLTFTYPGASRPALADVSVRVPAGTTLAVVGPVGSGKSTLVGLLSRLRDVPPGAVFLDGLDVDAIPVAALRAAFAFVPQDGFLFSASLRENVAFGRTVAPDDATVAAALRAAGLKDDLAAMPAGMATVVGERGITLSGGQRQRTTIARALVADAPVLVVDDALSAVDTRTEARILDELRRARAGRTAVVVAHRLSTVRDADRILVLDDGHVVGGRDPRRSSWRRAAGTRAPGARSASSPRWRSSRDRRDAARRHGPAGRRPPPTPGVLRRLVRYAARHRGLLARSVLVLLGVGLLDLLAPDLVRRTLDGPVRTGDAAGLASHALLLGVVVLLGALGRAVQQYVTVKTGQQVGLSLRQDVFAHLQRMGLAFYDRHPVGTLVTRVTSDIESVEELFSSGVASIFYDLVKLALILAFLASLDAVLLLSVLAVLPPLLLVTAVFTRRSRRDFGRVRTEVAATNAFTQEALSGLRVTRLFHREDRARAGFRDHVDRLRTAHDATVFNFAFFFPAVDVLQAFALLGVVFAGAPRILDGALSYGELAQFVLLTNLFFEPLRDLSQNFNGFLQAAVSCDRVFKVMDTLPAVPTRPDAVSADGLRGHVAFEDVRFHYTEGEPVLRGVSFDVPAGRTVALVGPTGAGKSSVVSLVSRFYDVTGGRVLVDGRDVRDYDPRSAARADRGGPPGRLPVRRAPPRERPPLRPVDLARAGGGRAARGPRRRAPLAPAGGPRRGDPRAGAQPLARRAAARRVRARPRARPGGPRPRRGDGLGGHRDRGAHPGGHRDAAGRTHDDRRRPPPLDDPRRRRDPRAAARRGPRTRDPRQPAAGRRPLPPHVPAAAPRPPGATCPTATSPRATSPTPPTPPARRDRRSARLGPLDGAVAACTVQVVSYSPDSILDAIETYLADGLHRRGGHPPPGVHGAGPAGPRARRGGPHGRDRATDRARPVDGHPLRAESHRRRARRAAARRRGPPRAPLGPHGGRAYRARGPAPTTTRRDGAGRPGRPGSDGAGRGGSRLVPRRAARRARGPGRAAVHRRTLRSRAERSGVAAPSARYLRIFSSTATGSPTVTSTFCSSNSPDAAVARTR